MADVPHQESIPRYPLAWPIGWVRTPARARQAGSFRAIRSELVLVNNVPTQRKRETAVSVFTATQRLERQLDLLRTKQPTLSTNVELRLDGRPRSDNEPADPGVAVYFTFRGKATVLACDRYRRVADNIVAIANHIDALRRIERYGVGTIEQALAGYRALPADSAADWRQVFGFNGAQRITLDDVDTVYKALARERHPDLGGTEAGMAHLNRAREFARKELHQQLGSEERG
jgi:hypothetical protein